MALPPCILPLASQDGFKLGRGRPITHRSATSETAVQRGSPRPENWVTARTVAGAGASRRARIAQGRARPERRCAAMTTAEVFVGIDVSKARVPLRKEQFVARTRNAEFRSPKPHAGLQGLTPAPNVKAARRWRRDERKSPARWAPVATGAQGESRDTREPRLSLSAVGENEGGVYPEYSNGAVRARPLPTA